MNLELGRREAKVLLRLLSEAIPKSQSEGDVILALHDRISRKLLER